MPSAFVTDDHQERWTIDRRQWRELRWRRSHCLAPFLSGKAYLKIERLGKIERREPRHTPFLEPPEPSEDQSRAALAGKAPDDCSILAILSPEPADINVAVSAGPLRGGQPKSLRL